MRVGGNGNEFPAQSQIQCEFLRNLPIVLHIGRHFGVPEVAVGVRSQRYVKKDGWNAPQQRELDHWISR
jgi:hypothetical protein